MDNIISSLFYINFSQALFSRLVIVMDMSLLRRGHENKTQNLSFSVHCSVSFKNGPLPYILLIRIINLCSY